MRLSQAEANLIKNGVLQYLPEAEVYLFGSRADDTRKGGDIDILILADRLLHFKEKTSIHFEFEKRFGEQKLDLVSMTKESEQPFKKVALHGAIRL